MLRPHRGGGGGLVPSCEKVLNLFPFYLREGLGEGDLFPSRLREGLGEGV